jgi:hypothetical protein
MSQCVLSHAPSILFFPSLAAALRSSLKMSSEKYRPQRARARVCDPTSHNHVMHMHMGPAAEHR